MELFRGIFEDLFCRDQRRWFIGSLLSCIPGKTGIIIRRKWYSKRFRKAGGCLTVLQGTLISNPQEIECGDNVSIGPYNFIQAAGGLTLGSDVMLGPYVKIWTANHAFADYDRPVRLQG